MWHTILGLFLVAHGLVTVAIWGPRYPAAPEGQLQPPDPAHSWIFGDVRTSSLIFGVLVGLALALAGFGFLTDQTWWPPVAMGAGIASLVLFGVFFTPWWSAGIAISAGLVFGALRAAGGI
jgi:hypothetical protein